MKLNNLQELDEIVNEWQSINSTLPEEQTVEVPLFVIMEFRQKCYQTQYLDTLKAIRDKLDDRIKREEI